MTQPTTSLNLTNQQPEERFKWNLGAWLGCQLGGTAWMIPCGIGLLFADTVVAIAMLGGCAVLNVWGYYLWSQQGRLTMYAACQRFLISSFLVISAIVTLHSFRGDMGTKIPYYVLALFPALMLQMWWINSSKSRDAEESEIR